VFSPNQGQEDVWEATEPLVQSAIDGFNVCIFTYGQTGSGKTYTMLSEPPNEGLIARSVSKLFEAKHEAQKHRCVKATDSNAESPRSHMLFTIHFCVETKDGVNRSGKLHICDLAGSERLNKSGANSVIEVSFIRKNVDPFSHV
jgi:hypothetical protein